MTLTVELHILVEAVVQNLLLTNVRFMTISSHLFASANQMVILRYWTGINLNWLKSHDKKRKCFHLHFYCDFVKKNLFWVVFFAIFAFNAFLLLFHLHHNFWTNEGLDPFSISKWRSEPQFCERYKDSWQKNPARNRPRTSQ